MSTIIVVILGTQAVAGFVNTGRFGWPILAYGMYRNAHFENDRLQLDPVAYAVLADLTRVELRRDEFGMDFWIYWQNILQPIRGDDLESLDWLIEKYCQQYDGQLVKFQVYDGVEGQGAAIGRDGPVTGLPQQMLGESNVSCE